jgi:hypothetical protein
MTLVKTGIATLAVALALTGAPSLAQANHYALVNIENPTHNTVHYSYRWGDGPWQKVTLAPHTSMLHSWQYAPGAQASPPFEISFDSTLFGGVQAKQYTLQRYAALYKDRHYAKRYKFGVSGYGSYLDLYSIN